MLEVQISACRAQPFPVFVPASCGPLYAIGTDLIASGGIEHDEVDIAPPHLTSLTHKPTRKHRSRSGTAHRAGRLHHERGTCAAASAHPSRVCAARSISSPVATTRSSMSSPRPASSISGFGSRITARVPNLHNSSLHCRSIKAQVVSEGTGQQEVLPRCPNSPANHLARFSALYPLLDPRTRFDLRHAQLVCLLKVLPQLGRGAEVSGKAKGRISRHPSLPPQNRRDSIRGHIQGLGKRIGRQPKLLKLLSSISLGCTGLIPLLTLMPTSSVVVHDLHVVRSVIVPAEADSPLAWGLQYLNPRIAAMSAARLRSCWTVIPNGRFAWGANAVRWFPLLNNLREMGSDGTRSRMPEALFKAD